MESNKWVTLEVFENAYKIMLNQYKRKHKSNNFFIDYTTIAALKYLINKLNI